VKRIYGLLSVLLFSIAFAHQVQAVPLAGTKTIGGTSPDYATIQAAVNDLHANGISAPVDFRLRNGTYNDQVTINDFTRTGAPDDTVTFRRQDIFGTVTWQYTGQGNTTNWVLKLDGASYITIRGMDFNAASASYFDIVHIEGEASNNIIEFCDFTGVFTNGNHIIQSEVGNHPNHIFRNNTFLNGDVGIQFDYQFGGADSSGLQITDNTFTGQNSGAVSTGSFAAVLTGNTVFATTVSGTSYVGFNLDDNSPIVENNIMDISKGVSGIWVFGAGGLASEGRIVNNLVALRSITGTRAIYSGADNISIYHNTVRSRSTLGPALWIAGASADVRIHNNILVNEAAVGGVALRIDDTSDITSSDHNNIYSTGSLVVKSDNVDYNTVAAYALVSGFDADSTEQVVTFVSTGGTNDLHLAAPSDNDVDLLSPTLASVSADYDGDIRSALTTYKGADEGTPFLPLDNADTAGGFYTIGGATPDYLNPNLAITDLKQRGMKGPVTFRVRVGSYSVHQTLSGVVRSGNAEDPIIFRAASMNNPPEFFYAATNTDNNWIIKLKDMDFVGFNFIDFTATGAGQYGRLIELAGEASDIVISNSIMTGLSGQTDNNAALIFSAEAGHDDLIFNNSTFNNGSIALNMITSTPFVLPRGIFLTVTNNVFSGQTVNAVVTNHDRLVFEGNDVSSSSNDMTGVHIRFNLGNQVHKNRFFLSGTNTTAVELEGADGRSFANRAVLANNFVVAKTGFDLNTGSHTNDIYFNTILSATFPINIAFRADPNPSRTLRLKNNILFNTGSGPAIFVADGVLFEDSNYNNFINAAGPLIDWHSNTYFNVGAFNAATGHGERSTSTLVLFADLPNADLHLAAGSIGNLALTGTPIDSITTDYDSEVRSVFSPYMGADEAVVTLINEYSIGGTVTGLAAGNTVVIHNSNGDSLNINSDSAFAFPIWQQDGTAYEVTVFTQPDTPTQFCSVTNGSGNLAGDHVTNIEVSCSTTSYSVGGTVSGLEKNTTVVVHNSNGDSLDISANGVFTFNMLLLDESDYAVTVFTQPSGPAQLCMVMNGSGSIGGSNVTNIAIVCETTSYSVGGSVSGLAADSSVGLRLNGGNELVSTSNGVFTFPAKLIEGDDYTAAVSSQPTDPNQTCDIGNSSGTIATSDITKLTVVCTTRTYSIGGNLSGLEPGNTIALKNNAGASFVLNANGAFVFPDQQDDGSTYNVTVFTQPDNPTQNCSVTNGSDTLAGSNISNIAVSCQTDTWSVGGTITGLAPGTSVGLNTWHLGRPET